MEQGKDRGCNNDAHQAHAFAPCVDDDIAAKNQLFNNRGAERIQGKQQGHVGLLAYDAQLVFSQSFCGQ